MVCSSRKAPRPQNVVEPLFAVREQIAARQSS
jgi:hypothetical protein